MTGNEYIRRKDLHPFWDESRDPNKEDVADAYEQGLADGRKQGYQDAIGYFIHKKSGKRYKVITDNFMFKQNGEWLRGQRIRQEIIDFIIGDISEKNEKCKSWIAWLEKQGKPKWSDEDEEELEIAIETLHEAGQHSSANWLNSLKQRVVQ